MAKKSRKKSSRSHLKLEALEARQLLAGITGGGTEVNTDLHHPNGNVYDQVLMTGSSVTVTADAGQVTRVSFLDLQGDIVQAEFSGAGQLSISLDSFSGPAEAAKYVQPGVKYVQGLASFTITGEDASTNFSVFSVGKGNAVVQSYFDDTHTGGDHFATVQRLTIVADPANPNGSIMGGIRAADAVFTSSSGVVGITAANVQVQSVVRIGDIDATGSATPALTFGVNSQFGSVDVAGGDLAQTNGKAINNSGSYGYQINSIDNVDSSGADVAAKTISGVSFTEGNPAGNGAKSFDLTTAIDNITGTSGDDVINASNTDSTPVIGALDTIDGGAGNDVLNIADSSAAGATLSGLTVKNVENFLYTSTGGLGASGSADTSGWTGLTSATLTLQDIHNNSQEFTAGKDTAIVINSNSSDEAGHWTVNGGSTVKITNASGSEDGTDGVLVNGGEGTTSVDVTQTQKNHDDNANLGNVYIYDANGDEADKAGTITTVSANGSDSGVYIVDNALTNLNLTNVTDWVEVTDNLDAHASADGRTTLAVSLNNVDLSDGGFYDGAGTIKQIDFTTSGKDSAVPVKTDGDALTGISVTGDKHLDLSGSSLGSNFATLTASGTGGVKATVGAGVTVTTSDGADAITLSGAAKHAVSLGGGDDWVQVPLKDSKTLDGGSLDGGDGTDTLSLKAGDATAASTGTTLAGTISGFETLELVNGGTAGEINLHNLDDINHVSLAGDVGGDYTLSHAASGATLTVKASQTGNGTVDVPVSAVQNETLAVTLSSNGTDVDAQTIHTGNISSVNLAAADTSNGGNNADYHVAFDQVKSVTISGNADWLTVETGVASTVDASALSKGGLTITTGAIAGGTISGTTHGSNNIDSTASSKAVTITTGGSADTIHVGTHDSTITAGDGDNHITADGGSNTVTTGKGADAITIGGTGTNTVTAGDGNDTITVEGGAVSNITLGGGNDTVVLNSVAGSAGYFTSITGAGNADKVDVTAISHGTVAKGAAISLGQGSSFSDYVAAATANDHGTDSQVNWFSFGGDTYIVVDNTDGAYDATSDQVIRLTGSVKLSSMTVSDTGLITIGS